MKIVSIRNRTVVQVGILLGTIIFTALLFGLYFITPPTHIPIFVSYTPHFNASMNILSIIALVIGWFSIKARRKKAHIISMISALLFSALFLIGYLIYHRYVGDTPFLTQGFIRPLYFTLLISHILATIVTLPLILITLSFAALKRFSEHKRVAVFTLPLWLYISVTGVCIYLMLRYCN